MTARLSGSCERIDKTGEGEYSRWVYQPARQHRAHSHRSNTRCHREFCHIKAMGYTKAYKRCDAILSRLNIDSKHWIYLTKDFESPFKTLVSSVNNPPDKSANNSVKPGCMGLDNVLKYFLEPHGSWAGMYGFQ
ncbi:MAG: hypothetical protein GY820_44865 [Gammaproteobacteria bacterium]|nr:hypothetical protein [Gammaproteobacteria bacterium]